MDKNCMLVAESYTVQSMQWCSYSDERSELVNNVSKVHQCI